MLLTPFAFFDPDTLLNAPLTFLFRDHDLMRPDVFPHGMKSTAMTRPSAYFTKMSSD